jgi:general secretion pathway protein D
MVIGGIITDNQNHTRQGVPFLKDLPLIGIAFRRDSTTDNRTTLYFFVTPHILQDDSFADLAEITYKKKLDAAQVIGADRLRVIDPTFKEDQEEVDWSQFGIPLYRSPPGGEVDPAAVGIDPIRREELLRAPRRPGRQEARRGAARRGGGRREADRAPRRRTARRTAHR